VQVLDCGRKSFKVEATRLNVGLIFGEQGDQKFWKKLPSFSKSSPKVSKPKKAKVSKTKLKLKVQNIYIKPLLKP
jgi:hypothetical protein